MAQLLEEFERTIEPLLSPRTPEEFKAAREFKALARRKLNALAVDAIDLMNLGENVAINGHAQAIRDRIAPDGAAQLPRAR